MSDENKIWRAQTYALLARLLVSAPDQELLDNLTAMEISEPESPMGKYWLQLSSLASQVNVQTIEDEYQTLFIGVTHGELIPYASYYLTGFLMEEPLAELRADLAKLGLERRGDTVEPEDHVAAECDVMRLILTAEGTPIVTADEFFNQHVNPWMERFFNDLTKSKQAVFYQAVGLLAEQFIALESRIFSA